MDEIFGSDAGGIPSPFGCLRFVVANQQTCMAVLHDSLEAVWWPVESHGHVGDACFGRSHCRDDMPGRTTVIKPEHGQ